MTQVFLLQNQHKELLNKRGEWVDGREARSLFNTLHHDEALNQKIEVNSKDYTLRISLLACDRNDKGIPLLKDEDLPPLGGRVVEKVAKPEAQPISEIANTGSLEVSAEPLAVDAVVSSPAEDDTIVAAPAFVPELNQAALESGDEDAVATQIAAMIAAQAQLLADKG